MFLAKLVLLLLPSIRLINSLTCDFNLIWYEANKTEPHHYAARQEVPESLRNAAKVSFNQKISVLWSLDLTFAKNLKTLIIDSCEINSIEPKTFKMPTALSNLSITRNNIRLIKDGVFNHMNVTYLDLSHNKLATIKPNAFDDMPNLTSLSLDYNELTSYALWFQNCPKLNSIFVQFNFIQYLPEGTFKFLRTQKISAYFSFNKISKIDPEVLSAQEYIDLYLDHNEIQDFDFELLKIDTLNLYVNYIQCLSSEFIKNEVYKVKSFLLSGNPLNCSCFNEIANHKNILVSRPEEC